MVHSLSRDLQESAQNSMNWGLPTGICGILIEFSPIKVCGTHMDWGWQGCAVILSEWRPLSVCHIYIYIHWAEAYESWLIVIELNLHETCGILTELRLTGVHFPCRRKVTPWMCCVWGLPSMTISDSQGCIRCHNLSASSGLSILTLQLNILFDLLPE